ncbi:hypothetical protein [Cellulomonas shaoxiangyii]|uniref:LuxR family transcriptional regulator n=1 Tax=Cellulomonas shaoxiangyii TaxID=2566013 RepID=A0A4P7SMZ2_9CELL|nr:hypothetical protein [Cellulomonas shaoxiangyii]QCB94897.1 hypothetical protein E5225_16340 [Cellulomonas shaoxiangyii]TGY85126.1 hypothetical protein E5226_08205 [Cellulomonas shaoxiangyii]
MRPTTTLVPARAPHAPARPLLAAFLVALVAVLAALVAGAPTAAAAQPAQAVSAEPTPTASEETDLTPDQGGSGEAARDNYPDGLPTWVWVVLLASVIVGVATVAVLMQRRRAGAADGGPDVADGTPRDRGPRAG